LPANHARLAAGEYPADPETSELRGAVAGVIGFGGIGRACADLFHPLGMRIYAINTSGHTDADVEFAGGPADLERVLRAADLIVVAIPLTRDTRGLIGARELAWMKPTAVLINVPARPSSTRPPCTTTWWRRRASRPGSTSGGTSPIAGPRSTRGSRSWTCPTCWGLPTTRGSCPG
jgi:D-arabinose 1-dehydrogenase-like Zn-dependent alcohol dehydrogenase